MTHKQFLLKSALFDRLREEISYHVEGVLDKYIKDKGIYFCQIDDYSVWRNEVSVEQFERQYRDYVKVVIPMKYFEDYDAAIAEDKEKERIRIEKEIEEQRIRDEYNAKVFEEIEKQQYLKLKEKYEK